MEVIIFGGGGRELGIKNCLIIKVSKQDQVDYQFGIPLAKKS